MIALGLAAFLAPGCGKNRLSDVLIPTGIRMHPSVGSGAVTARIYYDPTKFPDLASPPYPPTLVRLVTRHSLYFKRTFVDSGTVVDSVLLDGSTRVAHFDSVFPGSYKMKLSAHLFYPDTLSPIPVADQLVDAGDVTLLVNTSEVASAVFLVGDFNGFPQFLPPDSTAMDLSQLGVWNYPRADTVAQYIPAGTYQFRFLTDWSIDAPPDYGGDPNVTYTVPVVDAPTRRVSEPTANLKIRIDVGGRYAFTLDQRRQTFSIEPWTAPGQTSKKRRPPS